MKPKKAAERLIVALDVEERAMAFALLDRLPQARIVKVGSVPYGSQGPSIVREIAARGLRVFVDLKLHDIPNTVAGAIRNLCHGAEIEFFTVHASGGRRMIAAAREAAESAATRTRPRILAVTVLTSLEERDLRELGFEQARPEEQVLRLAKLAVASGADGLVCSPHEAALLRRELKKGTVLVVPGIRSVAEKGRDDQKRAATAAEAIAAGADYVVVGRPILAAPDPAEMFRKICAEMGG